jgi:hypothetical protein
MSAWETKDIIVVVTAVSGFVGTVVVQVLHPRLAAKWEREKIVEGIRRESYQKIITYLNEAITALMEEERPLVRKAFDALDKARDILWEHQIDISEDFRRACGSILYKDLFEEQFDADRLNTRSVDSTLDQLQKIRDKVFAITRKELKIKQSLTSTLYSVVNPIRINRARLIREVKNELKYWLRKLGFYRILNRFR